MFSVELAEKILIDVPDWPHHSRQQGLLPKQEGHQRGIQAGATVWACPWKMATMNVNCWDWSLVALMCVEWSYHLARSFIVSLMAFSGATPISCGTRPRYKPVKPSWRTTCQQEYFTLALAMYTDWQSPSWNSQSCSCTSAPQYSCSSFDSAFLSSPVTDHTTKF